MEKKIIVIGAGAAGLSAALELKRGGADVIVLEGRNRIGGRVVTDHSLGFPVDLGASWIHGIEGNPIKDIADSIGAKTAPTDYEDYILYNPDGTPIPDRDFERYYAVFEKILEKASAYADRLGNDISLRDAIDAIRKQDDVPAIPARVLKYFLAVNIESDYAADVAVLPIQHFWDDQFPGGDHLFLDGYETILNALAEGLDIRLNQVVRQVDYSGSGVTIRTVTSVFTGKKAVVTLPLGVLKAGIVVFSPALSSEKMGAIERLENGLLNKLILKFPYIFWPDSTAFLGLTEDPLGENSVFLNLAPDYQQPALLGFSGASAARNIEAMTDSEIAGRAMLKLRRVFGTGIPEPKDILVTRWGQDPFAFGAYSHIPMGATRRDRVRLAEPVGGQIYFAGEATHSQFPATVHGAYFSGLRAAREILG